MSLGTSFNAIGNDHLVTAPRISARKKRLAPFSIRLSEEERVRLAVEAAGAPLGAYIKAKALGGTPLRKRGTGYAVEDRVALAQGLALLGRSQMASSLSQLAQAVDIGALPMTAETESELLAALRDVRALRTLFIRALGLKPEDSE